MKIPALFALVLVPLTASAITRTWDGVGADFNFNNPGNWNPAGAPADGDDLVFPSTMAETIVVNNITGRTFGSIAVQKGITIIGSAFTLTRGLTCAPAGTGGTVIIEPNITLGAGQTFTSGGGPLSTLTFSGSVTFGAHSLTIAGLRPLTFGALTGSAVAGSQLIRTGTGQVRFGPSAIFISSSPFTWTTGSLDVDGIFQAPFSLTGGTLTGAGSLGLGLDASGGTIVPDEGDLAVSGATLLRGTLVLRVELNGPSNEHALECSGGSVTIQDQATLAFAANGYVPVRGDVFNVLTKSTAGPITGAFSNAAEGAEFADGTSAVRFSYLGGNGNDGTLTTASTTRTWDGGATVNDNWTDPDNWSGNIAPDTGDVLVFPSGIVGTDQGMDNDFPNDKTFRRLVFNAGNYTVRGNRCRLTHGLSTLAGQFTTIDTDVVLARDQTFDLNGTLHLDLLDALDLAGHSLTIAGPSGDNVFGTLDGGLTGSGRVIIPGGSNVRFSANSDYTGDTLVQAGAVLELLNRDEALGGSGGSGTVVEGRLQLRQTTAGDFNLNEFLTLRTGSRVLVDAEVITTSVTFSRTIHLEGSEMIEIGGDPHNELRFPAAIQGTGGLRLTAADHVFSGTAANTYDGPTSVVSHLILDKAAGVVAVPSAELIIEPDTPSPAQTMVETRQDEQIADNCHVQIGSGSELSIGNVTARTETIGELTLGPDALGEAAVDGPNNSRLILRGNLTVPPAATGSSHRISGLELRIEGTPCVMDIAQVGTMQSDLALFTSRVTRTGAAGIRKTGPGGLGLFTGTVSVPIEIVGGEVRIQTDCSGSPITLNGGTLVGARLVGGEACGSVTSLAGGGAIVQDVGSALTTGTLSLNAATTVSVVLENAATDGYGRMVTNGGVSLGGATLTFAYMVGFDVGVGQSISPILNDGTDAITGTFAGLPQGAFIPIPAANGGNGWIISYTGGTGNDVVLTRAVQPPAEVQPVVTTVNFGAPDGNGNRPVTIAGKGTPGASYRLENSVNLTVWTPEGTAQTANATTGVLTFTTSASPPVRLKQFWRFRKL